MEKEQAAHAASWRGASRGGVHPPLDRRARLVAQSLVLALVVGATSAFTVLHKSVTVDLDGSTVQVNAFGRTVGDVLADDDIHVGARDLVAPGLDDRIGSGSQIVVRHAHEINVEIDGRAETVWTTALTVGEAVEGLDLRGDQTLVSASRSEPLGRSVLRVSTQKTIHLVVDGQVIDGVTNAATVREALREIGLVLQDGDQVSVPLDATAVDGLVVLVTRASQGDGQTVTEVVPFDVQQVDDPTLTKGDQVVRTRGKVGLRTTTYATSVVAGAVVGRTVVGSTMTAVPVTQVVLVGAKPLPNPASVAVAPGSAQEIGKQLAAARGWGDDQFACLLPMWGRESGWRVDAANPSGAYGIPQALPGSKMGSVAPDWQTNPATQITWGLNYIAARYGDPCGAWASWQAKGWY
jgi:uncharacterized protein YabE (DUF348 family)